MLTVTVVDYGASNLLNVVRALEHCGAYVNVVGSEKEIKNADRLILPGVGAFRDGMKSLNDKDLLTEIKSFIESEKPYLGICLGMQFLFNESFEFGLTEGFRVLPGKVRQIPPLTKEDKIRRVPHIGWAPLKDNVTNSTFSSPLLKDIPIGESFYFVHSYMCVPQNKDVISSITDYMGLSIPASISHNNIHGTQFHPEKSGKSGLKILQNFLKI